MHKGGFVPGYALWYARVVVRREMHQSMHQGIRQGMSQGIRQGMQQHLCKGRHQSMHYIAYGLKALRDFMQFVFVQFLGPFSIALKIKLFWSFRSFV